MVPPLVLAQRDVMGPREPHDVPLGGAASLPRFTILGAWEPGVVALIVGLSDIFSFT